MTHNRSQFKWVSQIPFDLFISQLIFHFCRHLFLNFWFLDFWVHWNWNWNWLPWLVFYVLLSTSLPSNLILTFLKNFGFLFVFLLFWYWFMSRLFFHLFFLLWRFCLHLWLFLFLSSLSLFWFGPTSAPRFLPYLFMMRRNDDVVFRLKVEWFLLLFLPFAFSLVDLISTIKLINKFKYWLQVHQWFPSAFLFRVSFPLDKIFLVTTCKSLHKTKTTLLRIFSTSYSSSCCTTNSCSLPFLRSISQLYFDINIKLSIILKCINKFISSLFCLILFVPIHFYHHLR